MLACTEKLELGISGFEGAIPSEIGNCTSLRKLEDLLLGRRGVC